MLDTKTVKVKYIDIPKEGITVVPYSRYSPVSESKWVSGNADYDGWEDRIRIPGDFITKVTGKYSPAVAEWPYRRIVWPGDPMFRKLVLGNWDIYAYEKGIFRVKPYQPEEFEAVASHLSLSPENEIKFLRDDMEIVDASNINGSVPDRYYVSLSWPLTHEPA